MKKENIDFDIRNYPEKVQNDFTPQNQFIDNEELFTLIKTLTTLCPKLILAGSISLHVLGLVTLDFKNRRPDLDFGLTGPLDDLELEQIIALLDLDVLGSDYTDDIIFNEDEDETPKKVDFQKQEIIRLYHKQSKTNIDIFNSNYSNNFGYSKNENLYPVNFRTIGKSSNSGPHEEKLIPHVVYVQHPSVTISHKMKYAFYTSYGKRSKHKEDCVDFLCKKYEHFHKTLKTKDNAKKHFIQMLEFHNSKLEDKGELLESYFYERLNERHANKY